MAHIESIGVRDLDAVSSIRQRFSRGLRIFAATARRTIVIVFILRLGREALAIQRTLGRRAEQSRDALVVRVEDQRTNQRNEAQRITRLAHHHNQQ